MPAGAPPLTQVNNLEAILERILKELPDDVETRIGGGMALQKNDSPPRIVLQPVSLVLEPSHSAGGALFTRAELVRVHVWGKTYGQVEELVTLFANAVNRVVVWSAREGAGGEWREAGHMTRGQAVVFDIVIRIPVPRIERRALLTLAEPHTTDIVEEITP